MSDILIFAGTTEGRQLAQILSENHIPADLCVATEYGSAVLPPLPGIYVHEGRLEVTGMKSLYEQCHTKIIVDATHPYATLVTKTIQDSIRDLPLRYLRLGRDEGHYRGENAICFYDDLSDCIRHLKTTTGGILLTTGSKELPAFCRCKELKDRLVVRVLPGMESLKICLEQGLDRRQIIAIQGPFSLEMNKAMLLQYNCCHLVTKESGSVGGVDTKVLDNDIGYIEVAGFESVTADQFREGLSDLQSKNIKGLIIDLRNNPGGDVDVCVDMARQILPKGLVFYMVDSSGKKTEYKCDGKNKLKIPLAVLVNGNSASASEIFSGAVQDSKIGTLVGTQTFGKGIVQQTMPLSDGSAVKLTVETYYTPSGDCIHKKGIKPDIELKYEFKGDKNRADLSTDTYDYQKDNQIQKGIAVLTRKLSQ